MTNTNQTGTGATLDGAWDAWKRAAAAVVLAEKALADAVAEENVAWLATREDRDDVASALQAVRA